MRTRILALLAVPAAVGLLCTGLDAQRPGAGPGAPGGGGSRGTDNPRPPGGGFGGFD